MWVRDYVQAREGEAEGPIARGETGWNTRPIESAREARIAALEAENAELKAALGDWRVAREIEERSDCGS